MAKRITFDDLLLMDTPIIPGTWAAQAMGMSTDRCFDYARTNRLPFPVITSGKRVKVARIVFLKFWGMTDEQIRKKKRC